MATTLRSPCASASSRKRRMDCSFSRAESESSRRSRKPSKTPSRAAKIITQPDGNDGSRALRIPVVQKERAGRKPNHAQNAIQGLREHALDLAADKARGRQIEIRKRQHVALDAALFLFVERHDHEHGHERAWRGANDAHARALKFRRGVQHLEGNPEDSPRSERNA